MLITHARQFWMPVALVLALLGTSARSQAAFDAYLKLEGVEGESTDPRHPKWISITSFTHGIAGANATGNQRDFSELCLTKSLDKASPLLAQRCAEGTVISSAKLELVTASAERLRFYEITLSNVVVRSSRNSGQSASTGAGTTEEVCLSFSRIEWIYTEYDARGLPRNIISAWWDLVLNVGDNNVAPILRVAGAQVGPNQFRLSWPAKAGRTYRILGSAEVTGTFPLVESVLAESSGSLSRTLPMDGGRKFFRVEEAP